MRIISFLSMATVGLVLAAPVHAADTQRVKEIVTGTCSLCHGLEGESSSPIFPRLAAQHPNYMVKQLKDFREGRRKGSMNAMAADLKDDEIVALAAYFAAKPSRTSPPRDPEFAAVGKYIYGSGNRYSGVPSCASCHGPKAYGTEDLPRLAGQGAQYLEVQLKEFNQRARTNDNAVMHTIASKLTELETAAVARYISSLE